VRSEKSTVTVGESGPDMDESASAAIAEWTTVVVMTCAAVAMIGTAR
jgi:hypothetical protein